jgi:hypothetical protein
MAMRSSTIWRIAAVAAVVIGLVGCGAPGADAQALKLGAPVPEIAGSPWINSAPLTTATLRGRVVLVEFWTYG